MGKHHCWPAAILLLMALSVSACSQAFWEGMAEGSAAASGNSLAGKEILVFGGDGHKTFLGCLTCSEYNSSSLFSKYGSFGSSYSATSIFNKYSEFGSPYSDYSACNKYATDPPVLVDRDGNFYGRLTMNRYQGDAVSDEQTIAWLMGVCSR